MIWILLLFLSTESADRQIIKAPVNSHLQDPLKRQEAERELAWSKVRRLRQDLEGKRVTYFFWLAGDPSSASLVEYVTVNGNAQTSVWAGVAVQRCLDKYLCSLSAIPRENDLEKALRVAGEIASRPPARVERRVGVRDAVFEARGDGSWMATLLVQRPSEVVDPIIITRLHGCLNMDWWLITPEVQARVVVLDQRAAGPAMIVDVSPDLSSPKASFISWEYEDTQAGVAVTQRHFTKSRGSLPSFSDKSACVIHIRQAFLNPHSAVGSTITRRWEHSTTKFIDEYALIISHETASGASIMDLCDLTSPPSRYRMPVQVTDELFRTGPGNDNGNTSENGSVRAEGQNGSYSLLAGIALVLIGVVWLCRIERGSPGHAEAGGDTK